MSSPAQIEGIRRHFDEKSGQLYFSIVDTVGIVAKTSNPRNYWKVLKNRLKKSQNQLVTECNQLKMRSSDGKSYLTDAANEATILKIVAIISKKELPIFEAYFGNLELENRRLPLPDSPTRVLEERIEKDTYPQEEELELKLDVYRAGNTVVVKTFIAGTNMEDLNINATSYSLTISGVRKKIPDKNKKNYMEQELLWGKFSRTIEFPSEIDPHNVIANEDRGLLVIKLPLVKKYTAPKIKMRTI